MHISFGTCWKLFDRHSRPPPSIYSNVTNYSFLEDQFNKISQFIKLGAFTFLNQPSRLKNNFDLEIILSFCSDPWLAKYTNKCRITY